MGAVGEDETFHRTGAIATHHHQVVAACREAEEQIAIDVAEGKHVAADASSKFDPVDAAAVLNTVATVADPETVKIITPAASDRIGASST